jgi:hypothetical protein
MSSLGAARTTFVAGNPSIRKDMVEVTMYDAGTYGGYEYTGKGKAELRRHFKCTAMQSK